MLINRKTCSINLYSDLDKVIIVAKTSAPDFYTASLKCNPTHSKYAGGAKMRPPTHQNQAIDNNTESTRFKRGRPSEENVQLSKSERKKSQCCRGANSHLCGNLAQIEMHIKSEKIGNNHCNTCKV